MHAFDFSLFKVTIFDVLDILLVAFIIYQLYNLIKGTIAANIFIGLAIVCLLYFVVQELQMHMLTYILGNFMKVGIIAIVVVFQQEIRRFLLLVGKNASFQRNMEWWRYFSGRRRPKKTTMPVLSLLLTPAKA